MGAIVGVPKSFCNRFNPLTAYYGVAHLHGSPCISVHSSLQGAAERGDHQCRTKYLFLGRIEVAAACRIRCLVLTPCGAITFGGDPLRHLFNLVVTPCGTFKFGGDPLRHLFNLVVTPCGTFRFGGDPLRHLLTLVVTPCGTFST